MGEKEIRKDFVQFIDVSVGGTFDAALTRGIGAVAKSIFQPISDEAFADESIPYEAIV